MSGNPGGVNGDTFKNLYLDAAKVEGKPGLFFIGPFGNRVSFASQQRRALNTVWALEKDKRIVEGSDVAVVGGGLAGVTAAAALAARKCSVWLYESGPRVLNLQAGTMHRFVHPTVNFWPEAELDATTQFPFLDWYANVCSYILRDVHEEWRAYFERHLTEVYTETTVTSAQSLTDANGKVEVTVQSSGEGPTEKRFDAVVFATGFGAESEIAGASNARYWDADHLPGSQIDKKILVSGTGDGGLIDALRCAHRNFKDGRLTVELAEMLDTTGTKQKLIDLEKSVRDQCGQNESDASEKYAANYANIVAASPKGCREFLDQSLIHRSNPIRLIGLLPSPFSMNAATIHKFMISHAMTKGVIKYVKGKLEDGPILKIEGQPDEPLHDTLCIARHGATPPLSSILTDVEQDGLKTRQKALSDILNARPYDDNYWANWTDYPVRDPKSPAFAKFRMPLAASHVMREYKLRLGIGIRKNEPIYLIDTEAGGAGPTGDLPRYLFGVPTQKRVTPMADLYVD